MLSASLRHVCVCVYIYCLQTASWVQFVGFYTCIHLCLASGKDGLFSVYVFDGNRLFQSRLQKSTYLIAFKLGKCFTNTSGTLWSVLHQVECRFALKRTFLNIQNQFCLNVLTKNVCGVTEKKTNSFAIYLAPLFGKLFFIETLEEEEEERPTGEIYLNRPTLICCTVF